MVPQGTPQMAGPPAARRRIRQIALLVFLATVFGVPLLATTVLRDSGALVQTVILPGLLFAAVCIGFALSSGERS